MGVSSARHIQDDLLTGLPATTPVAIVQRASQPDQRHAVTTLGEMADELNRVGVPHPYGAGPWTAESVRSAFMAS